MSISIGSNFLYQGKKFLDDRLGKVNSIEDLKTWNIPIPDGFEVYLDGSWYTYNSSNYDDSITGKFRKRPEISQEFGYSTELSISQATLTEKMNLLENNIRELSKKIYPLEFKYISGGGNFEVGSSVKPQISWEIRLKGKDDIIIKPNYALVNNSSQGVSNDYLSWSSDEYISMNKPGIKSYKILVNYDDLNIENTVSYYFLYKKYYGTSSEPILTSSDILNLYNKYVSSNSYTMEKTVFDCTGGKYPYYVIPSVIYKPNIEFWIGGLKNTDLVINEVEVITEYDLIIPYTIMRLKNIQTGRLSIEIK